MRIALTSIAASLALVLPADAQVAPPRSSSGAVAQTKTPASSPGEIVAAAPTKDWVAIAPADLLVMTLAPDRDGKQRQVVIQLMPAPFSQGWVGNIRKLAAARWWDGLAITRVQDNYVVQWGDPDGEDKAKAKALPAGLTIMPETGYASSGAAIAAAVAAGSSIPTPRQSAELQARVKAVQQAGPIFEQDISVRNTATKNAPAGWHERDSYSEWVEFHRGWPLAGEGQGEDAKFWPVHCYGMVGVGRNYSPDTGSGAELYTVIGHAPRHLDRNIALVGRVVEGIEHLSSLPRGTGALGFYEKPEQRAAIASIRLVSELPAAEQLKFEYLSTDSDSFAKYADARANRRDPFFIVPAGGADICNIPVPVRRVPAAKWRPNPCLPLARRSGGRGTGD